jgi:hypothetical protein
MRFRKLRIAFSATSAFVCAILIVIWWRSYFFYDNFVFRCEVKGLAATSYDGSLCVGTAANWRSLPFDGDGWLRIRHYSIGKQTDWMGAIRKKHTIVLGFGVIDDSNESTIFIPYWFLCGASGICATILWPMKSRQFRLQTLLITTTLVAVVLGLAVYAASK